MKLKVCGITSLEQLKQLNNLGVDYAGLIFYENSKRFVGNKLLDQKNEIKELTINKVGVFVNAGIETIRKTVEEYALAHVQLHGDEDPEFCWQVQNFVSVIKAIRVGEKLNMEEDLKKYEDVCDYFLFDTDSKQYGGTGKQFYWNILHAAKIKKQFFLSGGIGLEDVAKIKAFDHPMLFVIDVNSRFEIEPGKKDMNKIDAFVTTLK